MKIGNHTLMAVLSLWISSTILLVSCQSKATSTEVSLPEKVDFNFHIKPILSDRCFKCHGPDEKARKADFRLDTKEGAFALLDSTENKYAIVAGNLSKSDLIDRISNQDPELVMPPPESNLSLSAYEIELLKRWIDQGAEWKSHWAFIPPQQPQLTDLKNEQNPIDYFIENRLTQVGLKLSDEDSKEKLIRRVSFDLRGLPPSLAEIDSFLADQSPKAYEGMVDRFLAQESFGERMALEWLDLARYADSHGYQDDLERSMWPWRDWVIQSFNDNMAYDQFVSWQLAGDLMPDASYEQKLATGFNRNHKITQEVGVINEEYRVNYVLDRTNTFSTAFLGLTVECAQCHDHKYDPISQKEYYSLFSFFNNVPEKGRVDYGVEVAEPYLPLPQEKVEEISTYIQNLFQTKKSKHTAYADEQWNKGFDSRNLAPPQETGSAQLPSGLVAWFPLDHLENDKIEEIIQGKYGEGKNDLIPIPGKFSGGVEFMGANYASLASRPLMNFDQPFSISIWVKSLDGGIKGPLLSALSEQENDNGGYRANIVLSLDNNKRFGFYLGGTKKEHHLNIRTKKTIPENRWVHLVVTYDGSRKGRGIKLYMNGALLGDSYILKDNLAQGQFPTQRLHLGMVNPPVKQAYDPENESTLFSRNSNGLVAAQLDELMLFKRVLKEQEIRELMGYDPIANLLVKSEKNEAELKRLFYHQLLQEDAPYQQLTNHLRENRIREGRLNDIVLRPTMVMMDMDTVRPSYILDRGQYDAQLERVMAGTPAAVLNFDSALAGNRLGLAKWLFNAKNPLSARVAVNRYWQMIFGRGLVATPEDFGSQGELPSHPELLDWLAVEFRESDWDVKGLLKLMVSSATYRQSVQSDAKLQQIDPENILLARGSQARLSAEMIRDHALTTSGLLSSKVGGPSVKPYQPEGLWLQVASGNQTLRKYIQDHGQDLYRRSLYTFWKRTLPPPSMTVFDAPSREQCNIKRRATSTPMQALVLLNDPQFVEASRQIAVRMLKEGGNTPEDRIAFAFRLATSRLPKAEEVRILNRLLVQEISTYEADTESAHKLLSIGEHQPTNNFTPSELAAYAVVANAILNLTETIRKG